MFTIDMRGFQTQANLLASRVIKLVSGHSFRNSSLDVSTTIAKITWVFRRRSIDVINEMIAAISHFNVNGPRTAVSSMGEAHLSYDLTLCQGRMSTV